MTLLEDDTCKLRTAVPENITYEQRIPSIETHIERTLT